MADGVEVQEILIKYGLKLDELAEETKELKKELLDLSDAGKKSAEEVSNGFDDTSRKVSGTTKVVKSFFKAFTAALTVRELIKIGQVLNDIQKEAEEVRHAFNSAFSIGTIEKLREATKGTVSDINLMKQALRARDLNVPIDTFVKSLELAKIQSGLLNKSITDISDSVVNNLGRNSPRALEQLGISSVELSQKVQELGDYYEAVDFLINDRLGKEGVSSLDSLADRQERLTANFDNLRVRLSDLLLPVFEAITDAAGRAVTAVDNLVNFGFNPSSSRLADVAFNTKMITEQEIKAYKDILEEGSRTAADVGEEVKKRIEEIQFQLRPGSLLRSQAAGGREVGDDILNFFGLGKEKLDLIGNAREEILGLSSVLSALKTVFFELKLGGETEDISSIFDINTASVKELNEEIDRLNQIISESNDRGIIAGIQNIQTNIQNRLDFLLGKLKEQTLTMQAVADEIFRKTFEFFDIGAELNKIGLSTQTELQRFNKARAEEINRFNEEIKSDFEKLNLFGRTEEEQNDFEVFGMSLDDYRDKLQTAADLYRSFQEEISNTNFDLTQDALSTFSTLIGTISAAFSEIQSKKIENSNLSEAQKQKELKQIADTQAKLVLFERLISIAQVGLNLQGELSFLALATAPLGPLQAAALAPLSTAAYIRAGLRVSTILATSIPDVAAAFKDGVSSSPKGRFLVGEEGPEIIDLPKGSTVYNNNAVNKNLDLIDSINDGTVDNYIMDNYVYPLLKEAMGKKEQKEESIIYDDYLLRREVKKNRTVRIAKESIRELKSSNDTKRFR